MSESSKETDSEDNSPATPDFNHSCSAYVPVPGAPREAVSYHMKHHNNNNNHHSYHTYRQLPCFHDIHTFDSQLGTPQADHDNQLGSPDIETNDSDVFLRYLDGLSLASGCKLVHYKEAVRERERTRLFTTYWELEETNRLQTLLASLYAETDLGFRRADREALMLLKALVTKHSLSPLRKTDSQFDLSQDHLNPRLPGASREAVSYHTKHHNNSDHHSYHPYRQPPCFRDIHTFNSQLGRPQADHDNQLGSPDSESNDVFLRCMDGLSPASCRYLVHYKRAVHERQRMRIYTTYWEIEETKRLQTFLTSLDAEADSDFRTTDREAQMLLEALVTKESLSRPAAELEYLSEICQRNKTSLRETDSQFNLLQGYLKQRQSTRSLDDTSNCPGGDPIITDN
ncbi:hypothetical protein CY34DRAFT_804730 [Suillus luteus UH-Slu-Lm8-n1]|uniref:Uncharacterized protein n=1 Tax=Suillus luteus UH-Slu-Lm8-n1 TaxID=930992 RepID=A0A0D0AL59_9AGAM|nr:hypothetical protein CY34DRAFT_804730 [Suillus luteus UH-Slu-Lm8-n1]